MNNLMAFLSSFSSYLLCFFVFGAAIVIAFLLGMALRKSKNKKLEVNGADNTLAKEDN